jgi:hypothetical protein
MEKELQSIIDSVQWRESSWVCKHAYIIRHEKPTKPWEAPPEVFNAIAKAIAASPYFDVYKGRKYKNLHLNGKKYWHMGVVINRKDELPCNQKSTCT